MPRCIRPSLVKILSSVLGNLQVFNPIAFRIAKTLWSFALPSAIGLMVSHYDLTAHHTELSVQTKGQLMS